VASRQNAFNGGRSGRKFPTVFQKIPIVSSSEAGVATVAAPATIYLKDYKAPPFLVDTVSLKFDLGEEYTTVVQKSLYKRNKANPAKNLVLNGLELVLKGVVLNGRKLLTSDYLITDSNLTILSCPDEFTLEVETRIKPQENTALVGLYKSSTIFCTQCEAEGFRRITYFLDRPDVMAKFTTTIVADRAKYPSLLSNGNPVEAGPVNGEPSKHYVTWVDPFKKPAYLFALVAGDLAMQEDVYVTSSGRSVKLQLFVEHGKDDQIEHAMQSLKDAMKWDEDTFGLEYDLDIYMIVAVSDFTMGAMENKGLNVFNDRYVLAKQATATDADFDAIQAVIGHEYFHNWTGNRVTCREWFQLSLKEGLTVFRDQQFSADMLGASRAIKRIGDVARLRIAQFAQDQSPMAHPVRPDSYIEINNFYTATVYEKGAEVVRMIHTLVGPEGFRRGMDLYFQRHDGQAVTVEDFVNAMQDANGRDLSSQFMLWYKQSGTPRVTASSSFDAASSTYTLTLEQMIPSTPGQPSESKAPLLVPVSIALLDRSSGAELPFTVLPPSASSSAPSSSSTNGSSAVRSTVLELTQQKQTFVLKLGSSVSEAPVPSIFRNFSAPVIVSFDAANFASEPDDDLLFRISNDTDGFNRYDASQQYASKLLLKLAEDVKQGRPLRLDQRFVDAFKKNLIEGISQDDGSNKMLYAQLLGLPSESYLGQLSQPVDPLAIHKAHRFARNTLAVACKDALMEAYTSNAAILSSKPYSIDAASKGCRAFKNAALSYLMEIADHASNADGAKILELCGRQLKEADNMTDSLAALTYLANAANHKEREDALQHFYDKWASETLVVNKWLGIQSTSRVEGTHERVLSLLEHPSFEIKNPNKVYALLGGYSANQAIFHDDSGRGYKLLADQILRLDKLNPQVAARMMGSLTRWQIYDVQRQGLIKQELQRILSTDGLSRDVYEIASKSLPSQ